MREAVTLLVGKAGVLAVGLWIFQIDFLMGHVEVAADDNRLFPVQFRQVGAKGFVPGHAVFQPLQSVLRVGGIDCDQVEPGKFQCDGATFSDMRLISDVVGDGERFHSGKDCRTGISLLLGGMPVLTITGKCKIDLVRLQFGLLQAEKISVKGLKAFHKPLLHTGPQPVNVPGDKFHLLIPPLI